MIVIMDLFMSRSFLHTVQTFLLPLHKEYCKYHAVGIPTRQKPNENAAIYSVFTLWKAEHAVNSDVRGLQARQNTAIYGVFDLRCFWRKLQKTPLFATFSATNRVSQNTIIYDAFCIFAQNRQACATYQNSVKNSIFFI